MIATLVTQFVLFGLYLAALLFWPAGTWAYPGGIILIVRLIGGGAAVAAWLAVNDPALLRKRMSARGAEGWDRAFLVFLVIVFSAWMAFAAWDAARHHFAAVPPWGQALGAIATAAYTLGVWATFRANTFAAPIVMKQEGQTVIDTGPYAVVRHPMYASALLLFIGLPLLLGSWWALIGSAVLTIGLAWRTLKEEGMLRAELDGYGAYTQRVRYRFVPLVW